MLIAPMLAEKADEPFDGEGFIWETRYDGARCVAYVDDGRIKLLARSGTDHTATFPELGDIPRQVHAHEAVLDGELVVMNEGGGHDFRALQSRIHRSKALAVRLAAQGSPATFLVFDVLRVNGVDLTAAGQRLPLEMRKALLARLLEPGERCRAVEYREGGGADFFQECILAGLEGVMAKERSGLYHPGKRDAAWLKIKGVQEDSFLVCGYTEGEGWREGLFGALLLGKPAGAAIRYCGSVGTGFTVSGLEQVLRLFKDLHTGVCPFAETPHEPRLFSYLKPRLVVDVKYHERTADGKLRFPVFVRVRPDLGPEELEVWT